MFDVLCRMLFPPHCFICRAPLRSQDIPYLCSQHRSSLRVEVSQPNENVTSLLRYENDAAQLIQSFKYEKKRFLIRTFRALLEKEREHLKSRIQADAIVAVPLTPEKEKERGFNQAWLLAQAVAEIFGFPAVKDVLGRKRDGVSAQATLSRAERLKNIRGNFAAGKNASAAAAKRILLVDDVITTGATSCECRRVLQSLGAAHISTFTLAATPLNKN